MDRCAIHHNTPVQRATRANVAKIYGSFRNNKTGDVDGNNPLHRQSFILRGNKTERAEKPRFRRKNAGSGPNRPRSPGCGDPAVDGAVGRSETAAQRCKNCRCARPLSRASIAGSYAQPSVVPPSVAGASVQALCRKSVRRSVRRQRVCATVRCPVACAAVRIQPVTRQ
jgi:hypothetical protein